MKRTLSARVRTGGAALVLTPVAAHADEPAVQGLRSPSASARSSTTRPIPSRTRRRRWARRPRRPATALSALPTTPKVG
ncbi:hypothetical protein ACU4GG_01235 [Streptomyces nojiriensis]